MTLYLLLDLWGSFFGTGLISPASEAAVLVTVSVTVFLMEISVSEVDFDGSVNNELIS